MNTSILILEDNQTQAKALQTFIQEYSPDFKPVIAHSIENAEQYLHSATRFSAFFIDIALETDERNTDGLQFTRNLAAVSPYRNTPVVFVTAYPEHVFHAINELHCYAYLLKPFQKEQVFQQLDQIFETDTLLCLRTLTGIYWKIDLNDIYYIQSFGRNVHYQTKQGEIRSRQYTMKALENMLPAYFVRCHKSYIVNTKHAEAYHAARRLLYLRETGEAIPCSRDCHFTL